MFFQYYKNSYQKSLDLGFDPLWTNSILSFLLLLDELLYLTILLLLVSEVLLIAPSVASLDARRKEFLKNMKDVSSNI